MMTIQQLDESSSKINRDHIRKQLAYLEGHRSDLQFQEGDKLPNMVKQIEDNLKLLKFIADSQFSLTQINGQRKLGPPSGWTGPPPGPKCEIFVGSIPRHYYEPEIVLIFSTVGKIYELRLMMEFSGSNRGYCFIMYTTEEEAARAVRELDQYEIYPGKKIGVVASANNCRLYVNQLPRTMDSESIVKKIYEMTDDIDNVAVYRNMAGFIRFALISYRTHRGAAMGRRRLVPEAATLFRDCEVVIEWANPNVTPSNVYEESGTCDEEGNVQITRAYIEASKSKKILPRPKPKTIDKRANAITNQRAQKSIGAPIFKGRPIKAATENTAKSPSNPTNQSKVGNLCSNCSAMKQCKIKENFAQAWDINGNLRRSFDQALLYGYFKQNYLQQARPNAILPSISSVLNTGKRSNATKRNGTQRCKDSNEMLFDGVQIYDENLLNPSFSPNFSAPCEPINKCKLLCSRQCRFHPNEKCFISPRIFPNNVESVKPCNSTGSLVNKFSGALKITNENDAKNCSGYEQKNICKDERQILSENNVGRLAKNFCNFQPPRPFANGYQFVNYYNNLQNNRMRTYVKFPNQIFGYNLQNVQNLPNLQNVEFLYEKPSGENFLQQFSPNNVDPVQMNQNLNWPAFLPNEAQRRDLAKVSQIPNGNSNDLIYRNNPRVINNMQQQNCESFLNPSVSKFDGRFAYENATNPINPINSQVYLKDRIMAENKPQFVENFRRL